MVPICQPRSASKGPVLVPRARGFLVLIGQPIGPAPSGPTPWRMSSVRPLVAPVAGELVPGQSQLDQALSVRAFRFRGPPHRGLGLTLWIVPGTHAANPSPPSGQAHGNFIRMIAG